MGNDNETDDKSDEPTGRAKGGLARAERLSPERRREIALAAARARHGVKATHKGNFKEHFSADVECYVLDDEQKTAVISQRGMAAAIGLGQGSGANLQRFVNGAKIRPLVGVELAEKLENPLKFQWTLRGVEGGVQALTYGYDVTILIDICKVIIKAADEGKLGERQKHIAQQARIIVNASAKAGIKNLVYALAGYDATRAEIIDAFKFYVREEAREYEREFPNQLYSEWYRLYELTKPGRNNPWKFKSLTIEHVYNPLARSSGKILDLARAKKAKSDDRHAKIHQFLSDVGVKALRTHLGRLLGIAETSEDRDAYERHVARIFGGQQIFPGSGEPTS